jgi:N-acyl homoserine lactone hydrolase
MTSLTRLFVLDYGLFQVHENQRVIGIPGFLIQTNTNHNILVDTGFPARYATDPEAEGRTDGLDGFGRILSLSHDNLPAVQLARIGLEAHDITHLIVTHTHIDHIGGWHDFPQATLVIGRAERSLERPLYFGNASRMTWPSHQHEILVDHDLELLPGLHVLFTPGHSPGHLSVLARLPHHTVLLAGDAINRATEPVEGFSGAWDETLAQSSAERLLNLARLENATVIYGHDPEQWKILPKAPNWISPDR